MFWQLAFCNTDRIALCHYFIHLKYVKDFILKKKEEEEEIKLFCTYRKKDQKMFTVGSLSFSFSKIKTSF